MTRTIVYAARKIITLDPTTTEATHVAVCDGRILAVGGPDCVAPWGAFTRDDRPWTCFRATSPVFHTRTGVKRA